MYFININITKHVLRVNLKMKKATLCCCCIWIVFIEINFTVAFLLIGKTWDDGFASKGCGMEDFKKWGGGILVMRGMILK